MNILYVDDEKLQLENFRLTVAGIEGMESVHLFSDSAEAYEWAEKNPVDVAFLDIEMPKYSGITLAQKLKDLNRRTAVVFVTAYDKYTMDAFKVHASGYLLKPYSKKDVERELENASLTVGDTQHKRVHITTMPDLVVMADGKNIFMSHGKQEELFALLVDRGKSGVTKGDAINCLGDGKPLSDSAYWSWLFRLKSILEDAGLSDLIETSGNTKYIKMELVDCDLYKMQQGNPAAVQKYAGRYLQRYSWAEERIPELDAIREKVQKS
ncbi:LytR/AlgR family response regulator transcription factor [Gemmiger sp.]